MDSAIVVIQAPQSASPAQSTQPTRVPNSKPPLAAPAAPSTTPPTSSALAYIPATLTVEPGVSRPDLRPIHPWDLTSPIPLTDTCPIFYDASTQEYFLFTAEGAQLLHKTSKITIPKKTARKFLYDFPNRDDAVSVLGSTLKIPKSSNGKTIYCPNCTSYRTPLCINLNNLTPKAPQVLGKITMPIPIARIILSQCLEQGTTKLSIHRAYRALSKCFNMHDVSKIPVEQGEMVANLLWDCLFVEVSTNDMVGVKVKVMGEIQRVCWAKFFNISEREIPRGRGRFSGHGQGHGSISGTSSATVATAKKRSLRHE
ncbi:hypothetical protein BDV12DRAFT_199311 [Aspergillus spectabilis]